MEYGGYRFDWDPEKAEANLHKHGVAFPEAATTFVDTLGTTVPDHRHSEDELRLFYLGMSARGRLLAVSYTDRGERIRIISARLATRQERRFYEQ